MELAPLTTLRLGGPARRLISVATEEELGGAQMHATVSGCGDNLAHEDSLEPLLGALGPLLATPGAAVGGPDAAAPEAGAEPDEHDIPVRLDPPAGLDLRAEEIASVVWCTGFAGDFSWLDPGMVGAGGHPRHTDGAAPAPGLWYLGLRWMRRRCSGILLGFPGDAVWVADEVRARLGG